MPVFSNGEETVTLGDLVAAQIASQLVSDGKTDDLRELVGRVQKTEIREQVRKQVAAALTGPPRNVPVTLADLIIVEANAQIHQGDGYQGTATPLKQVVAAEVYTLLHDEVLAIVTQAREQIRERVREAIISTVDRQMGHL